MSGQKGKGGRPRKKPGYDKAKVTNELISKVVDLYEEPYDDRDERSDTAPTIESVAEEMKTTPVRIRKMLITAGCFSSAQSRKVQELHRRGYTIPQIREVTGLGKASVHSYLPYSKGIYNLEDPTLRAERGRVIRKRIRACEKLAEEMMEENLWEAVKAFEGYIFRSENAKYQYSLQGEEMVFDQIRVTRSTLMTEFRRVRKIQEEQGTVNPTQCMECLYLVFTRLGVCD